VVRSWGQAVGLWRLVRDVGGAELSCGSRKVSCPHKGDCFGVKGADMSYTITISENGQYIICRVTGSVTVEISREFAREMDSLSRATNIKRFLTDVREAPNIASVYQNYEYAYKDMIDLKLQRDVRSAILADSADTTHDFLETVVRNAGYNVRVFRSESAAIAWLNEEMPNQ